MTKIQVCKNCHNNSCKECVFKRWVNPSWYEYLIMQILVPTLVGVTTFLIASRLFSRIQ